MYALTYIYIIYLMSTHHPFPPTRRYGIHGNSHELPPDTIDAFLSVRDVAKTNGLRGAERLVRVLVACEFTPRLDALNPATIESQGEHTEGVLGGGGTVEDADAHVAAHETFADGVSVAGATAAFAQFVRSARRIQAWLANCLNAHHCHYVAKRLAEELCVRYVAAVTRCAAEKQRAMGILRRFSLSPTACALVQNEIVQIVSLMTHWVASTGAILHVPAKAPTDSGRELEGWERAMAFANAFALFVTVPPPFLAPIDLENVRLFHPCFALLRSAVRRACMRSCGVPHALPPPRARDVPYAVYLAVRLTPSSPQP